MDAHLKQILAKITYNARGRAALFTTLSLPERAEVFLRLSQRVQRALLSELSLDDTVELLDHLDPRLASRSASLLPRWRRKRVIERLQHDVQDKLDFFLRFHPDADKTLISIDYVVVPLTARFEDVKEAILEHHQNTGRTPGEILVIENGEIVGHLPAHILVQIRPESPIKNYVNDIHTVSYTSSPQEIVDIFLNTPHDQVVIKDKDGSVIGIVYSDDIIALLGEQETESLYNFAGVEESEEAFDPIMSKVKRRYRWLILNLATAFLAAAVVGLFENTINEFVLLAIYMPVIAGMGGNAATQSLAVTVRSITMGQITFRNGFSAIYKEVGAGFINGAITGVLVATVAVVWNQSALLGFVVGISLIINLIIAGFFGVFIPLLLRQLGKDPATSATIFITTATDVFGFFVFLGLATLILL